MTIGLCVALSVLATALLLIIAEFGVRFMFRDVTTTADNTSYFALRWRKNDRTNRWGFREREFDLQKPSGVYRIALIGDSITYGQGVAEANRFGNILERELNQRRTGRYEVLNFGRPGAETIDHMRILLDVALPSSPDFVLLQWFTNDIEGHDKSGRPRPFRLIPSDRITSHFQRTSALFYLLNMQWITLQTNIGWTGSYDEYMLARFGDPRSSASVEAMQALRAFIQTCKQRGLPAGLILFTSGYLPGAPLEFLSDRVLDICREERATCLDMRPTLAPYNEAPRLWASRLDPHPGPLVHRLAADRLVDAFWDVWAR